MNRSSVALFLLFASCSGARGLGVGDLPDASSGDRTTDAAVTGEQPDAFIGPLGSGGSKQGGAGAASGANQELPLSVEQLYPVGIPMGRCGTCGPGQECCYPTGRCYDLANPADCPRPAPSPAGEPPTCSSNAQCGNGFSCQPTYFGLSCTAAGVCRPHGPCNSCGSPAECALSLTCGCDGKTYSGDEACKAKVRVAGAGPCGTRGGGPTACKDDSQCFKDERCCHLSGLCVDRNCATCCSVSPMPDKLPCESDRHCYGKFAFCFSENGQCEGPGLCTSRPSQCTNELAEVCSCDGKSYLNRCSAQQAGVRIKAKGRCPN